MQQSLNLISLGLTWLFLFSCFFLIGLSIFLLFVFIISKHKVQMCEVITDSSLPGLTAAASPISSCMGQEMQVAASQRTVVIFSWASSSNVTKQFKCPFVSL